MRNILLSAIVAAVVSFAIVFGMTSRANLLTATVKNETAFERVKRTGKMRCAYWSMQPLSYKDVKTGELKGFAVDLFNEIAKRLSIKAEWVEEVNFATMMTGLDTNRYDAICTGAWLSADRSAAMEYTWPYMFSSIVAAVREDDKRFDADINAINDKNIRISVQDGLAVSFSNQLFPEAQKIQLPDMVPPSQSFVDVETGKADVAFTDASDFINYSKNNLGKLRLIHTSHPLRLYPWVIPVRKGEHDLASLINGALAEMVYAGEIEQITKRNGVPAGTYGYFVPNVELK